MNQPKYFGIEDQNISNNFKKRKLKINTSTIIMKSRLFLKKIQKIMFLTLEDHRKICLREQRE